jgi:hypothetical protein
MAISPVPKMTMGIDLARGADASAVGVFADGEMIVLGRDVARQMTLVQRGLFPVMTIFEVPDRLLVQFGLDATPVL